MPSSRGRPKRGTHTGAETRPSGRHRLDRAPRVGDQLGPYRLCVEIARGGMATVYLARAEGRSGLHRFVALKCIHPELARDQRFVEMFTDEANLLARIHHANVCSVLDFDEYDGVYCLAMEYLRGKTLGALYERLREVEAQWQPEHRAGVVARIMADAAEGLHAAHELRDAQGRPLDVVHRDVSPSNIFLTYDGNVKLMDFGIACASHQRHTTRTGVLKGKYAYLQPEVLRGQQPDRRADVWGLGVVAWELLTLERLFDEDNDVDTIQVISTRPIPPPSSVRDGVPKLLDEIVLRALERDPAKRYANARLLGQHLTRYLVEQRLSIGLAEVAESMDRLFPSGRACDDQLVEIAGQLDSATVRNDERRATNPPVVIDESAPAASVPASAAITPQAPVALPGGLRGLAPALLGLVALASLMAVIGLVVIRLAGDATSARQQPPAAVPTARPAEPDAPGPQLERRLAPGSDRRYLLDVTPVADERSALVSFEDGSTLVRVRLVPVDQAAPVTVSEASR